MRYSPLLLILALVTAIGCNSPGEVLQDFDGDGSLDADDCGPDDDTIHPGAADSFGDGIDQDCDGSDGVDLDGDGYPSLLSGGTDCVDTDPQLHPADTDQDGFSTCDGDCDDEDAALNLTDADQDQFSSCTGDCDDANAQLNPNQQEVCDLLDNDCDGVQADDEVDVDLDGDPACNDCDDNNDLLDHLDLDSDSLSLCGGDCDDTNPEIYPGAADILDGIDTDCDLCDPLLPTVVDESGTTHIRGDGVDVDCDGYAENDPGINQDCDDQNGAVYPGSTEAWESPATSLDINCDGSLHNLLSDSDYSFLGESFEDQAGRSVSSAGDVDGDGLDDILVGANLNADGGSGAGKIYLILGSSLSETPVIDLATADYSFVSEQSSSSAGISVASAGDVDGDGLSDILMGAWANDDGGFNAGKAYLILGSSLGSSSVINLSMADYSFVGEDVQDLAGGSVSSAGDVDGDGLSDVLVGAKRANDGNSGKAYLILSSSLGSSTVINLSMADYSFVGESERN